MPGACGGPFARLLARPSPATVLGRFEHGRGVQPEGESGAKADIPERRRKLTSLSPLCRLGTTRLNPSYGQGSGYAPAAHSFNPSKPVKDMPVLYR